MTRKNPSGMVPPQSNAFIAKLQSWHGGQGDPIYAVASSWGAGKPVSVALVERASVSIAQARRQVRESKSPRAGSIAELDRIEEHLDMLVRKYGPRENPMATTKKTKSRASKGKSKSTGRKKTAGKKPARSAAQKAATKRLVAMNKARGGKAKPKKARKNPIRTKAGRVLKATGSKKLASKLLRARGKMKAVGLEGPDAVKTGKRGRMTYESAQQILKRPTRSNPRPMEIDEYLESSFL